MSHGIYDTAELHRRYSMILAAAAVQNCLQPFAGPHRHGSRCAQQRKPRLHFVMGTGFPPCMCTPTTKICTHSNPYFAHVFPDPDLGRKLLKWPVGPLYQHKDAALVDRFSRMRRCLWSRTTDYFQEFPSGPRTIDYGNITEPHRVSQQCTSGRPGPARTALCTERGA
jgi:hypothetical protein